MIYLLLAALLWGTSFVAGKYAEPMASPEVIVLFRMLIAAFFIAHLALPIIKQLPKKILAQVVLLGFLTYPLTFLLQFIGLRYTSASNAAAMLGFEPLLVMLAGHYFFQQRTNIRQLMLAGIAFVGILFVLGIPDLSDSNFIGCAIVLSSTLVVAVWLQLSKSVMPHVPKGRYTALTIFFGALLTIPSTALINDDWNITVSGSGIAAIIYLGVGCSLLAGWLWNVGLEKTDANISGLFFALEPVFGVVFALVLLSERPDMYESIGIALVLFAVLYSFRLSQKEKASRDTESAES